MGTFMNTNIKLWTVFGKGKHCLVALGLFAAFACAADSTTPTISLRKLPENLQKQYEKVQPELTERNRCVVAFVDSYDAEKMILECSFHTRVAAESERRALKYCNEKRKAKEISSPCRVVVD
jgi:hypothetical protein